MSKDTKSVQSEVRKPKKGHTHLQWGSALLANIFTIHYGMQIGWLSSVSAVLQSAHSPTGRPLTDNEIAWIASLPPLVSAFSASPYSWIADRYGRRLGIMTIGLAQTIAWVLCFPANPTCIIVSRIFCGIGAGGCYNIVPMFIKEISQDNMRGILGFTVMLAQNIGVLIIYGLAAYVDYYVVLWILAGIPIINAIVMMKAPESPVYLVKIGKSEEAAKTIAYLRGLDTDDKVIQNEMNNIKREDETFKAIPNIRFIGIFKNPAWRNGFMIMFLLMAARGSNGGMAIIMYASTILRKSGVTINPELQSMSFPTFMIVGCFAAMTCVEKLGRKPILIAMSLISFLSFAGLAVVIMVQERGGAAPGWVPVVLLVVGEFAFAAGVSPLPFIIMSEMFNFQIRAKMMGILSGVAWFMTFVQCLTFGPVTNVYGAHVSFFCFAVINAFGIAVTLALPETKGKNIAQIENALVGKKDNESEVL